ncbi:unnamed protein product [Adineta steineri]|uniref:ABC-type xenobiotic transporter n=1 Tax=Adineta steineri TaxID=433720 RepID=A0A818TLG9_9BILA|nr:unnamed protein product [Adineta steineri]
MGDEQDEKKSQDIDAIDLDQNKTTNGKIAKPDDEEQPSDQNFFQRFRGKKKDKKVTEVVSLASLFRYATKLDILFILIGTAGGLAHGVLMPLLILVFGGLLNTFTDRVADLCTLNYTATAIEYCPAGYVLTSSNYLSSTSICNFTFNGTAADFQNLIVTQVNYLVIIGCVSIVFGYLQIAFWSMPAERQTRAIRENLFRSILRKEIVYFDTHKTGELNTKLTDDIDKIHDGIGDKLGSASQFLSSCITGLALGFAKGWKLTLVILSVSPLLFFAAILMSKLTSSFTAMELKSYGKAGAVAEEVLSSIRTVFSYNGQKRETKRYEQYLEDARTSGIKKGGASGFALGLVWFFIYCAYALGFWYGAKLIRDENYNIGNVIIVFFSIIIAVFNLGQASPHFQTLTQARAAAYIVWEIIDAPSKIVSDSETGLKKDDLIGDIEFSNIKFSYPSRPGVQILNNISFDVQRGQTIALVGSSGSGKSTCVQLLQRFYDADAGIVRIDGHEVKEYNLKWLRQHIGVVSQEPILFQASIRENILFGRDTATDAEIHEAAKMANAHDFIMTLPDKYETAVGERGAALSGGQKQRIAIARALIRDPKILLLDEATSALDNESEKIVQDALDRAAQGRTTLVIAHRLSTIRNADKIVVMHKGEVVEEGDHESLMDARGTYYSLVEQQNLRRAEEEEQLQFEKKEITELVLNHHTEELQTTATRNRASTIVSLTPSVMAALYGKNKVGTTDDDTDDDKKKKKEKKPSAALIMLKMNRPEWIFIAFGCVACTINGGIQPVFGIILSKLTAVFQICDKDTQKDRVLLYILLFIGFGILLLFSMSLQGLLFALSGEALTKRLRGRAFQCLLRQEISYFDNPKNNTGALCTRLATEASAVQGATGIRIGTTLQNLAALGTGIIISFVFSWQLTLLILGFVPLMVAGGVLQSRLMTGFASKDKATQENAGQVAIQSIQNIRTVVQLTKEDYFFEEYRRYIGIPYRSSIKRAHLFGFFFALTSSVMFFSLAALFRLGAYLVAQGDITFEDVLLCFNCIIFGAQSVGQTAAMSPDYTKAVESADNILELLNRKPAIDNSSTDGEEIPNFTGQLDFEGIHFIYPNRPESIILRNFKLKIQPGQQVALVGTSGCGKSTTIQLVERFYDANVGRILADSKDVRALNLQWYRQQIGFVSQEPILFDMSIKDNIAYGDNSRDDISMEEIIKVAQSANIHDFIQRLPEGYDTNCGAKGTQLSGGQKQRIAIARALLRDPKILLLDEATSALDSESEKIVQDALDKAQENRTSITIAHRLSTIQNADMICVLHNGVIVESGTSQELLALGGRYYRLAVGKLK